MRNHGTMSRIFLGEVSSISLPQIQRALADVVELERVLDGSGHAGSDYRAGWIHGLSNTRLFLRNPGSGKVIIDELRTVPAIRMAVDDLRASLGYRQLNQVMVNLLDSGGKLAAHRDGLPDDNRYHLPVVTNPRAQWWDEFNGTIHMDAGFWYGPVPYCGVLHSVVNNGHLERLHLVADFQK